MPAVKLCLLLVDRLGEARKHSVLGCVRSKVEEQKVSCGSNERSYEISESVRSRQKDIQYRPWSVLPLFPCMITVERELQVYDERAVSHGAIVP